MSDEEMKDIWMNSHDGQRIKFNIPNLIANLKIKIKKIDRTLFFRDAREIAAAVVVMVVFSYKSYTENILVSKMANALVAIWCIYVIYRLLDVRKYKQVSDLGSTLKMQLAQQKMYLQKQAHLLDTALTWYIAPPAVLGMISIIGRSYSGGFEWGKILLSLAIILIISWGIYVLNRKAAKSAYQPLIENIDNILAQLDERPN